MRPDKFLDILPSKRDLAFFETLLRETNTPGLVVVKP
jgi:hypothetical protein